MKTIRAPRPSGMSRGPEKLATTFYPGDMDKIGFSPGDRGRIELTNDATLAHKLHQWFQTFQQLTQVGVELEIGDIEYYKWQEQAQALLAKSKEFM